MLAMFIAAKLCSLAYVEDVIGEVKQLSPVPAFMVPESQSTGTDWVAAGRATAQCAGGAFEHDTGLSVRMAQLTGR
jgi:hypothetical protein